MRRMKRGWEATAASAMAAVMTISMVAGVFAEESSSAEEAGEAGGYPITLTCSDGSEIQLEEEPQTIVSMGPNMTEIVYSLDAGDKLIGRTDYCDYPEEVLEVESVGSIQNADIEKILSLEPDLVLASTHFSEESIEQLEAAGIPVLYLYDGVNMEGVYDSIRLVGEALNRTEEADLVVTEMEGKIAWAEEQIADTEPVSVYYVVGFGEYGDYTAGGDTFIHGILEAGGGENVAAEVSGWSFSTEALLEADPQVIILPAYSYDEFMEADPYTQLTAVQEGSVYTIDNNMLDRQSARNADAVVEVASILHPEAFPEETEYPLVLNQQDGETVTIESCPTCVVFTDEELAETAEAERIASGVVKTDALAQEDVEALTESGVEMVLATEELSESLEEALTEAGITILQLDQLEGYETEGVYRLLGHIFNENTAAEAFCAAIGQ